MTLRVISPARAAVVAIFVALIATLLIVSNSAAAPVLTTDKEDYYSNETVPVTGSGFAPNTSYDIPIIRPDGSIVVGDGSFIPGWDSITSDGAGGFLYLYQLDGIFGTYEVRAYVSPWSGDLAEIPVASMEFTDADINFQQCQNDDNNDEVQDACVWTNGGLNQNNSLYTEGSAPPQRLFHRLDEIGAHVFNFEFEFSKSDSYAYDFITNADETLGALLNECANLPGFISSTECTDMFSTNVQFGDIPSDPFDGVGLRENPAGVAARQFRVGCTPACSVGVTVEFPDPPTGPTDGEDNPGGEAHTPDSDPDCFRNCGDSDVNITVTVTTLSTTTRVGMWFAGHLSETADPIGSAIGWGTGCNGGGDCGSSSISGAPFHFKYICLQEPSDTSCGSVGNRDNQIQSGGVAPPETFPFTVAKDFSDDSTAAVTVSLVCTSGSMTTDDATATEVPPDTADFTVSSPSGDPTCTATETPIPAGYTSTGTCSALLSVGTCTIVNTLNSAQFEVLKDFSDDNTADVTISVSCTSGSVTDDDTSASEADRANFTVTGFTYPGTTCTATESGVPFGYTTNDSDCQDGDAISPGGTTSCTMVNTVIPPTLTVNKVCDPPSDPGLFNLRIDASTEAADAACGGTTSAVTVSVGAHVVDETAGTGTSLGNYTTVISGDCNGAGDVTLAAGENKICTITNTLTTTTETDVKITAQTPTAPASANINTNFNLAVDKTLHNNGPLGPVDVSITPVISAPPDCSVTPVGGNPTAATLNVSTAVNVTENFTINCTNPSTHLIDIDNCIAITTTGVTDTNPANNCWPTQQVSVNVLATSDVKVSSVTASSPASVSSGTPFTVSATASLHNNGTYGPTNVDTTFTLSLPGDCSTGDANPTTVQDTSLAVSTAVVTPPVSWSVTCTSPSSHVFTVDAAATIDQQHVSDSNGANDSANNTANTAVTSTADLKVSSVSVSTPVSASVGATFVATVTATVHNNGLETPVNADATLALSVPADCTATPTGGQDQQNVSLAQSTATNLQATWDVSCTDSSNHQLDGSASVTVDDLHISDPTPGNDSGNGNTTISVLDTADLKVSSVSVSAPASEAVNTAFNVTVTATLHNNGLETPVNADTTLDLSVPADCTRTPNSTQTVQDTSLVLSTATPVQATWSVTCTDPSNHQFDGSATVSVDQLHVAESNGANNAGNSSTTTSVLDTADLKVSSVSVSAPASEAANTAFNVTVTATLHNNGLETPVNADTTLDLSVPADCIRTPNSTQTVEDTSLALSTATPVQATWSVTCTDPSNHTFDGSATVSVDQLHVSDPTPGNDSNSGSAITVIGGQADVKISSVTVDAPTTASAGVAFNVTVTATLHNNGPDTPAPVDTTLDLSVPADCTPTPTTQTVQDTNLPLSTATPVQITWSVTCTNPSNHQFDGSATVTIDSLHLGDPNTGNNSGNGSDTTSVLATTDVKITAQTETAPTSANTGTDFTISVDKTLHNNGPTGGPVDVSITPSVSGPADCTITPAVANPASANLAVSVAAPVTENFTVNCTTPSTHTFSIDNCIAITTLHVSDSNSANNCSPTAQVNVNILATTDVKITAQSETAPASANTGADFTITVDKTLHNNGPTGGPVDVSITPSVSGPPDCTITPAVANPASAYLAVSVAAPVTENFTVNCANPSTHTFSIDNCIAITTLHVSDSNSANNCSPTAQVSVNILASADVKVTAQSETAPASAATGADFTITVDKTLHNNGPTSPVDVSITPSVSGPPDCTITPAVANPASANLAVSVAAPVTENFTVNCASPSTHTFSIDNCIAITTLHVSDSNSANNCSPTAQVNVNILATTDLKVSSVTVTAPATATTGTPFDVTVTATLHNNGPTTPVDANADLDLSVPADCTPTPTTLQQAAPSLVQSTPTNVQATWSVSCSNPSNHTFNGSATVSVNQLHVTDTTPGNDSGNGSDTTAVSATTDVKITAQSETAPASANTGADFTITVDKTLHNNGSTGPVDVSITPSVSGPADCTITPAVANPASANLAVSTATPVTENFTVNCTNPSTHTFSIDNCIAITTLHVSDSNSANNCSPTTQVSVDILATADLKIPAVTISGPASITINTAFNIEATADAHNNGPATPVNADTTFTLTLPTDCTTPSTNPETLQDTPLPVSVNTTVSGAPVSWTVTCTDPVAHTFVAEALVTIDQLHVADPISSNDKLTDEVIITPPTPTTFTVLKDFSDDNPADVTVSLTCSTGTVTTDDATASESDPADFTVDGATTGTSCTATEFPIPVGYTSTGTCNAPLSVGTCTIINSIGGGGGGTPNPVGGIVGLLGAPDDGPQSAAQGGNNVMLVLALAAGAAILIAATSAWVSRTVRRP